MTRTARHIVNAAMLACAGWSNACSDGVVAPCNFDEDCRADAVCLEGVCALRAPPIDNTPPPAPVCDVEEGTHDGGDGTCVALDACSEGFTLLFRDGDGDGVGSGARVDCGPLPPLPPPLGLADVDGDCDDDDPAGFVLTTSLADEDNDGFTTTVTACGDGAPPEGAPLVARHAPMLAAYPADPVLTFEDDLGDTFQVRSFLSPQTVDVASLRCPTVPFTPQGFAVHVRLRVVDVCCSDAPVVLVASAQFLGEQGGDTRVALSPPAREQDVIDIVIGGASDTFGVNDVATACASGVRIDFLGLSVADDESGFVDNVTVRVDTAWLEVFGAEDCDDSDATRYTPALLYDDSDDDGQGGGEGVAACLGSTLPAVAEGLVAPIDCDDSDPNVRVGQTLAFSTPSVGGTFDYDCSGDAQAEIVQSANECTDDGKGGCFASFTGITGPCGTAVDASACDGTCALVAAPTVQACR
jgi:hypothetical protein